MNNKIVKSLLFLAIVLSGSLVYGQDDSTIGLRYGVRLGGVAGYFGEEQPHTGAKLGFTIGGVVEYGISPNLSLQAEPAYMQQGGKFLRFIDDTRFGNDETIFSRYVSNSNITVHAIDLPILAKYKIAKIGDVQLNVMAGPSVAYTLYASDSFERTYTFGSTFSTINGFQIVTSQYQPFQLAATGGVGGEVSLGGTKRLLIDLRYRYGITPVKKGYSYIGLYDVQGDLRTHAVYFTLGLGF